MAAGALVAASGTGTGREAVGAEEALHVRGRGVARLACVDHCDLAPGSSEDQGCREAGCASADHHYVEFVHTKRVTPQNIRSNSCCWFWDSWASPRPRKTLSRTARSRDEDAHRHAPRLLTFDDTIASR